MRKWTHNRLKSDRDPDDIDRFIQLFFAALIIAAILRYLNLI